MEKYTEFMLYEELLAFFDLESDELLAKMHSNLQEVTYNYFHIENFVRNSNGEIVMFLNLYQLRIALIYEVLVRISVSRN